MVISGVVFDIDDTLYDERDYVRSGFRHVAELAGRSDAEIASVADWLWATFEAGARHTTIDRLLDAFPSIADRVTSSDLVAAYRSHAPVIKLGVDVAGTLDELWRLGLRLGGLSDGPAVSQAAKVKALELDRWLEPILLTGAHGPSFAKPGTAGFEAISRVWGISPAELVYVGDNPEKDFAAPRQLGWRTVRVRQRRQLRWQLEPRSPAFAPDLEVASVGELLRCL